MAYSELVKNLDHIRRYMRDFYLYGFKSREEFGEKSLRSYDDEKRRLESWLGDYMGFRRTVEGKYAFISIDSRHESHNPLYKAWKAKSFTSVDITMHFILFDIFTFASHPLSLLEIIEKIDSDYLSRFDEPMVFDESTVRKKLKEYADEGLLTVLKEGKKSTFAISEKTKHEIDKAALDFYSEIAPCGVIGSFLLDKQTQERDYFAFKHHYITSAIDSGILCDLFEIRMQNSYAEIITVGGKSKKEKAVRVLPLQIYVSVQNGRQYLMAWHCAGKRIASYRIDYILKVKKFEKCEDIAFYLEKLERSKLHTWGVLCKNDENNLKHVEFTVKVEENETFIYRRLMREKRCGFVETVDKNTLRFSADVYDLTEMMPWIRTFICRITSLKTDDKIFEEKFKKDLKKTYELYGVGGDGDAV